jgi:cytochrome c oxidase cbb3-type subunit 3
MVAWKSNLSSSDIQKIASYILTLKGSNPAGAKAAEGEVWKETAEVKPATETVTDSTKVAEPAKK